MLNRVYKPSAKALRRKVMKPTWRLILLGNGSAMLYEGDTLIQSDVAYRGKDSHLNVAHEPVPEELKVSVAEAAHIARHGIKLPVKKLIILN